MEDEMTKARKAYLERRLRTDLLAVDFQWSLLCAALNSYRHDTVLRPFPPMFQGDEPEDKKFRLLADTCDKIPCLSQLELQGDSSNTMNTLDSCQLELLHWVVNTRHFNLSHVSPSKFSDIKQLTGQVLDTPIPNHIFEVVYSEAREAEFESRRAGRDVWCAYHGSRVENFHSILHYGLASHMNKNALFGEGTYLSSELSVSMPYAPTGTTWEKSLVGHKVSCIAVCEIIDDPSVKCQVKDTKKQEEANGSSGGSRTRARIADSLGGEVPEKYYVVRNNEMLRVKWVLVYADKGKTKRRVGPRWWVSQHPMLAMMLLYALLLVVIGLYNSKTFRYYLRRYLR